MNRRNCIKLLAALLPCAIVARMLGEKDLHGTPSPAPKAPNPAYKDAPYEAMMFNPKTGFHTEIQEIIIPGYREDGSKRYPYFRAIIRDCKTNHVMSVRSPFFFEGDTQKRRWALDFLYKNIAHVTRQRQFPKDTLIYDTEVTVNGVKLMNPRYPK